MSDTEKVRPVPAGYHTVTPYLVVDDPRAVLDFVRKAFDAEVHDCHEGPDGLFTHGEFKIGDSMVMIGRASDEWSARPTLLHLYVEDADALYRRAIEAGATSVREPETMFYGDRSGGVEDSQGNQWWISTHVEDVSPEEMERRQAEMANR